MEKEGEIKLVGGKARREEDELLNLDKKEGRRERERGS